MSQQTSSAAVRLGVALIIGLIIGAGLTYAFMSMTAPPTTAPEEYEKKIQELQSTVEDLQSKLAALQAAQKPKEYIIGATIPLTGELTSVAAQWKNALDMGIEELNEEVASYGINAKFKLVILDDKTKDEEALKNIQTLYQAGVRIVLGPAASSQVKAVKAFADENKIVVFSPSSTAPTLAIPDDYIFRNVGSDAVQAKALAKLVWEEGVKKVVVFHRDDEYGLAFANFFEKAFSELGGTAISLKYATGLPDYASEVAQLSSKISQEGAEGVVMITFDTDGANILSHAKDDPVLTKVRWFSSEGVHGTPELTTPEVAQFLNSVGFYGTRPVFKENPLYREFVKKFVSKYGVEPPVFTANLYDSLFISAWAILKAGEYSGPAIKDALPKVASHYYGVSGWCVLDEAGDRLIQDYAIWTVAEVDGVYKYKDVGSYSAGTITWG